MVERVHELESPRSNLAVGVVCASSLVSCMTMSLVLRRPGFEPIFNHTWLACLLHCCIFSLETIHTIVPMKSSEHVLIVHFSLGTKLYCHRFDPGLSEWKGRSSTTVVHPVLPASTCKGGCGIFSIIFSAYTWIAEGILNPSLLTRDYVSGCVLDPSVPEKHLMIDA